MSSVTALSVLRRAARGPLYRGASVAALTVALAYSPVAAQTAAILRASAGLTSPIVTAPAVLPVVSPVAPSSIGGATSASALAIARQAANQSALSLATSMAADANAAARAAVSSISIPNGLIAGGLVAASNLTSAALDPTGRHTWQGASAPVQTGDASAPTVTITQTELRALLSWDSFNISKSTTLVFNQQPNYVVVNRIVDNITDSSGRIVNTAALRPSQIFGAIKAAGTVIVINQNGVIFGPTAQINTHSFLVSSLEIGGNSKNLGREVATLQDRSVTFLQNGLLDAVSLISTPSVLNTSGALAVAAPEVGGDVSIERGAAITAGSGGFVIIAAPKIVNAGQLSSVEGQVSLQSGRVINATASTGSSDSIDPSVRGLILSSTGATPDSVTNLASGQINVPRGYISLGSTVTGAVTNNGILTATTSPSRNGKIVLRGAAVTVARGAGSAIAPIIAITPDTTVVANGSTSETIPQSADSVAAFKRSEIIISGAQASTGVTPSVITIGSATATAGGTPDVLIYAPSANVSIGATNDFAVSLPNDGTDSQASSLLIGSGVTIDVGGIKDYAVPASRNSIQITPVKRNELRDTPNYREPLTPAQIAAGAFTLNGTTVFVDGRLSGTRADGVAWVGSPLIEAGSYYAQIGITASELMTKGGNLTLGTRFGNGPLAPAVTVRSGAQFDISGGWVKFEAGTVETTRLLTADGRIVDIGKADPNDNFVGIASAITVNQDRYNIANSSSNAAAQSFDYQPSYTEGRDAGSLTIKASTNSLGATVYANAFAGTQQIAKAKEGSAAASIARDVRTLQASAQELPVGGLLKITAMGSNVAGTQISDAGGADIIVYRAAGTVPSRPASEILLSDSLLSNSGFGEVALQTSGKVSFLTGSALTLGDNGALVVDAGRTIDFAGSIDIPSGTIAARTYEVAGGSIFSSADDEPTAIAEADYPTLLPLFDINVSGPLSTRGRWINDSLVTNGAYFGGAFTDGGSISLTVAPRVLVAITPAAGGDAVYSADLSGSIRIRSIGGGRPTLDVSGGGYIRPDGSLSLTGKGGNVALVNQTVYAQIATQATILPGVSARAIGIDVPGFVTSPATGRQSALSPIAFRSQVDLAPGSIAAQGFTGGGTFTLVTPDLAIGSNSVAANPADPARPAPTLLDSHFFTDTGFANFALTSFRSTLTRNVFSNGLIGNTVLLDTNTIAINAANSLNLTQSLITSLLDSGQIAGVRNLASGGDVRGLLGTAVPTDAWDRKAVSLSFGGLTEVDVLAGGTITGSDGASLTSAKIFVGDGGMIRIAGGTVTQAETLPTAYASTAIGVRSLADVFGGSTDANGRFDETQTIVSTRYTDTSGLSNGDLATFGGRSHPIYFTGLLGQDQGIVVGRGGTIDLSGAIILNPRAGAIPNSLLQKQTGRIVAGGTLQTSARFVGTGSLLFARPQFGLARYVDPISGDALASQRTGRTLEAAPGSTILLAGASGQFDVEVSLGVYELAPVWSNGGKLTLAAGGSIAGSSVDARGGTVPAGVTAKSEGGVLTWLNPVLTQDYSRDANNAIIVSNNGVAATQIGAAGFDTFVAQNRLTSTGDVNLRLGRAFYLTARAYDGDTSTANLATFIANLAATSGTLAIDAPYIHLESPQQQIAPTRLAADNPLRGTGRINFTGQTVDVVGGVYAEQSVGSLGFDISGDFRLTGVQPTILTLTGDRGADPVASALSGQLVVNGDLSIKAAQVYPTTGTGSLQQEADALHAGRAVTAVPYLIASTGAAATIRFARASGADPATPYSAGGNLLVQAAQIVQEGVLRAPIGRLTLGSSSVRTLAVLANGLQITQDVPLTSKLTLGAGSITSVSANGLSIPYGTTTDLIEYFFAPASDNRLFSPPAAELRLAGDAVNVLTGATVDASGGGDLYAYEFAAGVGGSHDLLSRFNSDPFSSRNGLQYADGRQVYAIVPSLSGSTTALYDPIYSADYGNLYASSDAGRRVFLEAAPGLVAGWYTLLPAQYALLPGGMRVVENVGSPVPAFGESAQLRDGSVVVGGHYGVSGTNFESPDRRSFTVENQTTFRKFSNIQLTSATTTFGNLATRDGLTIPRLPTDAARLIFTPLSELSINGRFITAPATGGRGSQVDISGNAFQIIAPGGAAGPAGTITLTTTDFTNLNAASLLIGGVRTDNSNGSTDIFATSKSITIANDAAHPLNGPEIVLAVDGLGSSITIADGASITATGALADTRSGTYVISASATTGETAIGGIVRVANGPERLIVRPGALALANSLQDSKITIGEATLTGQAILLDDSRDLVITDNILTNARPLITASNSLAIGGDDIFFTVSPSGFRGLVITPDLEAQFAAAQRFTIVTKSIIGFSGGTHSFNDLVIDARGIRPYGQAITPPPAPRQDQFDVAVADLTAPIDLTINAHDFSYTNSDRSRTPCAGFMTVTSCGSTGNTLTINATAIHFGSGGMGVLNVDKTVTLNATRGIFIEGSGALDIGVASLVANTPFFGDRALVADPRGTKVQPTFTVFADGDVTLIGGGAVEAVASAPGATLAFGSIDNPILSFTARNIDVRATAGTLDVRSTGSITVTGTSVLETPGYSKTFGDSADAVVISAPGGALSLVSLTGDVVFGSSVKLSIGGGTGEAGSLLLSAGLGKITLPGSIDANAPNGRASFDYNSGLTAFDFGGFLAGQGKAFTGDIRVRTGTGDLKLNAGQILTATTVRLTADGGLVDIAGTIDTSGINGGSIGLFGTGGVALRSTALLDASADGYGATDTRAATGGAVTLGTSGAAAITVASGAIIDVAARRPGARLVTQIRKDSNLNDQTTYNYAQSDTGGTVTFRAPALGGDGAETVNIAFSGAVRGARDVSVEAYRRYDLDTYATDPGFTGVSKVCDAGVCRIELDVNAQAAGKANLLSDIAPGTIATFVRSFNLSAANTGLGSLRSDPNFHARPGVELTAAGDVILLSNWNLAAGTVDLTRALADQVIVASPVLGNGLNTVAAGQEANIFNNYTDFIYRTEGKASGEAPVLSFRAGGNLNITGSITDGFFTFADQTDSDYLSFLLGGGNRQYKPAFNVICGSSTFSCGDIANLYERNIVLPATEIILIATNVLLAGADIGEALGNPAAPYNPLANTPGALGAQIGGAGDPIGSAILFPLLSNGRAAASSSFRLVAGAAPVGATTLPDSADPLSVAVSSPASVTVSGSATYRAAPIRTAQTFGSDLQLRVFDPGAGAAVFSAPGDFINTYSAPVDPNTYTRLTFTSAPAAARSYLVAQAQAYFTANNTPVTDYQFVGPANNPTSLTAGFGLITSFLQSIATDYAARVQSGQFAYAAPNYRVAPSTLSNPNISTRTLVRTGTGSIEFAAARDVDLSSGPRVFHISNDRVSSLGAQVGGAAVYTAGHRLTDSIETATVAGSATQLQINANFVTAAATSNVYRPTTDGVLNLEPVFATGGGSIGITAGRDVLARRDIWAESFRGTRTDGSRYANVGTDTQLWRVATTDVLAASGTTIRINPQLFSGGVGALAGGSIEVSAARDVSELLIAADTSVATARAAAIGSAAGTGALTLQTFGGGNVALRTGRDVLGGFVDVASGAAAIDAGGAIASSAQLRFRFQEAPAADSLREANLLRLRVDDANIDIRASKAIDISSITSTDGLGYYSSIAGVSASTNGDFRLVNDGRDVQTLLTQPEGSTNTQSALGVVLPGSLVVSALFGDLTLTNTFGADARLGTIVLAPSAVGQLRLFAGGNLAATTLSMDDGDPSLLPGMLGSGGSAVGGSRSFGFAGILPGTTETQRRRLHNQSITHALDSEPVRIFADGNINQLTLSVPKQARISAGGDITDIYFLGQNVAVTDVTRITAGRDIVASTAVTLVPTRTGTANLPVLQGNEFVLGGPGALFIEAGRDLGPFINSAIVKDGLTNVSYAGGIITVGNDYNPWLGSAGAKIYAQFGVAKGTNYNALRATYVDPANVAALDGDLFVQSIDVNGNRRPDRTKPVYATALVAWLVENQPGAITAAFGAPIKIGAADVLPLLNSLDASVRTQFLADLPYLPVGGGFTSPTVAINRTVAASPVLITDAAGVTAASAGQRTTISGSTLIGWLAQNAPSVLMAKYGVTNTSIAAAYSQLTALPQLVQRQFLLDRVYFNELAAPSRPDGASYLQYIRGYRATDLLFPASRGYTANDLTGATNGGTRVETGNLDLRLATFETQRGGDITILGPGGRVLGGSVVATSSQPSRRGEEVGTFNLFQGLRRPAGSLLAAERIYGIPTGYEGVLTLRGGSVRGFTDGDFLLNQSRLFTLAGGDVTLWSSNGDLNAGQGAKTTADNPPVVVRFDPNGFGSLDQAGAVTGAGIAAQSPTDGSRAPDVTLIAPVGTVDAGDAGVRAGGNVFVAAATVANADNFKVGGSAIGIPAAAAVDTGAAASANSASAAASQAAAAVNPTSNRSGDDRSRISVEVLGFAGESKDDPCAKPLEQRPPNCPVTRP